MGSLFSAPSYDVPDYEPTQPLSSQDEKEPVAKSVRDDKQRQIRGRRALSGTILTMGEKLGSTGNAQKSKASLGILGRKDFF